LTYVVVARSLPLIAPIVACMAYAVAIWLLKGVSAERMRAYRRFVVRP